MNVFGHSGDAGDVVASLPVIRHLGGGEIVLCPHVGPGGPRENMTEAKARFLIPLLLSQPYITDATFQENKERVTLDISTFRDKCGHRHLELLTHWQGRHLGIEPRNIDMSPWLKIEPSTETSGKIVVARSQRYHNPRFYWRQILKNHHLVFVGIPSEHAAFCREVMNVPYRPVRDALEMARLIAGSKQFVGNQSLPCWIAMGLGHPLVQETYAPSQNSCVIRPNAVFVI